MKAILHALSYGNIELESSRRMADLKQLDAIRIFVKKLDASQAVLDIRNDLAATMDECREVTEQYSTGRSAYLRLGQLFMRLFAGLL